jgi:hypothetical protein
MGTRSLLDMRPMLPRKGIALLYAWAGVGDKPESVEDIFLLRLPLEVAREVDMHWTETALHARLANWCQWVPFSTPCIHTELRFIASCNQAYLDPSLDVYDPMQACGGPHRQLSQCLDALHAVGQSGEG